METSACILRDVTEMLSEFQSVVRCELLKKIYQGQQLDRRKSLFEGDQSQAQVTQKRINGLVIVLWGTVFRSLERVEKHTLFIYNTLCTCSAPIQFNCIIINLFYLKFY